MRVKDDGGRRASYGSSLPEGIDSIADLPRITAALLARSPSPADLHKLLGGNLMRVFASVQSAADNNPSSSS